tara:strand:- start:287 stop:2128 length:1842 start_codon:yes stop_codon:yes gene_type:complete
MAIEKTINIDVNSKKAQKEVENLEKAVEGVNEEVKETSASTEAMGGVLDSVTGGAVSKFKGLKKGLKGVITSFKTLRVAIISTGIGALVIGVVALAAAFKGSEDGQNKFAKITTVIGAAVGNLVDLLADLGENIISVFENPKQALKDFTKLIKENLINRFEGLLELIPNLGRAVSLLFKGEFKEAGKVAADAVGKVTLGVDSITDSVASATEGVKGFIKEQEKELKQAASVADMRAKADKIERKLIVDRSKLESEIANLRLKSRQEEEFSAAERKQALLDAQVLEDQLLDKETEFLELRRDAQILENTFSRSNKENLTKEAEAIAAVNRQQAARANTARQVQREVNTISKQIEAENKQKDNEEKARIKELDDFKKTLRDAEAVSEQQKRDLQLIKIQEHYDNLILQAEENNIKTDELEAARDEAKRLKQKEFDDKDLAAQKATADASLQIQKLELDAKQTALNGYASALSSISGIIGQETEAGKGLAIASSLVNTYASIAGQLKAFSGVPVPGYAIAQAIATGVVGFANVKKIASVKIPKSKGSGGAVSGSVTGGGGSAPAPPSFNIVGASDTNQLADAIGGQTQQPVQAFVVANDVTTAQSLENNIVEGATL